MATLEIGFNCMHLFAPQPSTGTMHVLMPSTKHHVHGRSEGHAGGGTVPKHVVRILHPSLPPKGIPMEDWELVLGGSAGANAPAPATQQRTQPGELANITRVSKLKVSKDLIDTKAHDRVVSRVTLRAGAMTELLSEVDWYFDEDVRPLAYEAIWRIEGVKPKDVTWNPLRGGTTPPVPSLTELEEENGVIRIRLFHVLESALPPKDNGTLDEAEIRRHFHVFYHMLGTTDVKDEWLPRKPKRIDKLNCVGAIAAIEGEESDEPSSQATE
ncbi:MAG TPA: hypothetical protein VK420_16050 [Longimicrobium sp.]|jgi:hypothetical protein|nr:hypothetical protein [Longimicrobium sp.]